MEPNSFGNKVKKCFTDHPASVGESYWQHMRIAFWSALQLLWAGVALVIHSVFPCIFVDTASDTVKKIHQEMAERKAKRVEKGLEK